VYVVPFPEASRKWQVSTAGGEWARWTRKGSELLYMTPDRKFVAASVKTDGRDFVIESERTLFSAGLVRQPVGSTAVTQVNPPFDVTADGERLLINGLVETVDSTANITVLLNWQAALAARENR
jgi:hypothetical protein